MPEPKLPTAEEIAALPRWARVAFAARCARRAQPYFLKTWPDAPEEHRTAIDTAIIVAEAPASNAALPVHPDAVSLAILRARAAAVFAANYAVEHHIETRVAAAAAYAAAEAAEAAEDTTGADHATKAATRSAAADQAIVIGIIRDFQLLVERYEHEKWTGSTPISARIFDSPSDSHAEHAMGRSVPSKLRLSCYISPSSNPEMVGDKLIELYDALNNYSIEKYGKGLTIDEFEQFVCIGIM